MLARSVLAIVSTTFIGCAGMPPDGGVRSPAEISQLPPGAPGHGEGAVIASDGTVLYVQGWRGAASPRGVVVIVHGLRDHGGRYARLAKELVKRGFVVYAPDLRGHGRSRGRRVVVDRFDRYVTDLKSVIGYVRAREGAQLPVFVMGHSMGGAVAALYAERVDADIAGLVLSAPAIKSYVSGFEQCGANLLADLSPFAPRLVVPMEKWSRDRAVRVANEKDPLVYQPGGPIATGAMLLEASAQALEDAPFVHVPTIVFHGRADGITDPAGSDAFVKRIRSEDKTLKLYPKLFHDLWNEPEREILIADLVTWLEAHAPGPVVEGADDEPTPED